MKEPDDNSEVILQKLTNAQPDLLHFVSAALFAYPDDVWDVVQETNIAIIARLKDYQPDRPFLPWALGFAKNKVLDFRRKKFRDRLVFDETLLDLYAQSAIAETSNEESYAARMKQLLTCVGKLPPNHRALLQQHYLKGLPLVKIAAEQQKPESTIRVTLLRIRKAIADCMKRLCRTDTEDSPGDPPMAPFDQLLTQIVDSPRHPPKDIAAFLGYLRAHPDSMGSYCEQMSVHFMLAEQGKIRANKMPCATTRPVRFRRFLRQAAGLALLLAGIATLAALYARTNFATKTRTASVIAPPPVLSHSAPQVIRPMAHASAATATVSAASALTACVATASAATRTETTPGETTMKTNPATLYAVAAASFTLATSPALPTADASETNASQQDSPTFLLETRLYDSGESPEQKFDTVTPTGTIYKFF